MSPSDVEYTGDRAQRASMKRLFLLFATPFLMVPLIGLLFVRLESPRLEKEAYLQLESIARLKVRQIENWTDERVHDGYLLTSAPGFMQLVSELADSADNAASIALRDRLRAVISHYRYEAISLFDSHAVSLLQVANDQTGAAQYPHPPPNLIAQSGRSRTGAPVDTNALPGTQQSSVMVQYYILDEKPHIDFSFPLYASNRDAEPLATLVLHVIPDSFLFPYVSSWPLVSNSGETLLVMRSGEDILFITPLRFDQSMPGTLTRRLNDPTLPAAYALSHGASGIFKGKDYRGTDVLAAYRAVGSTGWQLIAKIDRDEVIAPLYRLLGWIGIVSLLAATLVGLLFIRIWQQQQYLHAQNIQAERDKAGEMQKQFYDMPFIGIATTSPDSKRLLIFNDRMCDILGYTRDELAGKDWAELTYPEDLEADIAQYERVMRNESDGYSMDKRFIRKDGSLVYAYIDVKCLRKTDGKVDYFVAMLQDITERKQAELALEQSRQRTQRYLDIAGVLIVALDTTGRIQMVNRKACELLGYSEHELLGENWIRRCVPVSEHDDTKAVFNKLAAGDVETAEHVENAIVTRDGSRRLIVWQNAVSRDEHGTITSIISSGTDITDERSAQQALAASEARLRTLVRTIPDLVWLKDANGVYLACNPTFERLYGASETGIKGKTDYDFVDKELADFFREHDRIAMDAGHSSVNEEMLTFSDGYQGLFETTKTPMHDAHGRLIGVLGISHDITRRVQAASHIEKLSRLYETLSQTNQAIVRCANEQDMFAQICRNAVEYGHYKMAWTGLIDEASGEICPVTSFGEGAAHLEHMKYSINPDSIYGNELTSVALRDRMPYWSQDFLKEYPATQWREHAAELGFAAAAALPLWCNNKIIGNFTLYAGEINAFDEEALNLLVEMAMDISFALDSLDREKKRTEAEQRLALIIEGSNDAPWDWNLLMDDIYYSPQWWQLFGYEVGELEADSGLWRQMCHADDVDMVENALRRILQPGHDRDSVECRFRHKDGHYVPVLIRGIVSRNETGKPIRLTGTFMDLTAQKEHETALREQLDELNRWFSATIGREERMLELKQEINALRLQQHLPPRYTIESGSDSERREDAG